MTKFLIKKSFFGGWDNLIPQFLYNIICMAIIALFLFVYGSVEEITIGALLPILAVFLLLFCVYSFGVAGLTHNWSTYQPSWGRGFFSTIGKNLPHLILFYFIVLLCALDVVVLIPFYMNMMSFFGFIIGFIQMWVILFVLIAMQYFIPLCLFLEEEKPFFILKQSFVLFLDNKVFTLFVSIKTVFDFLVSALSFFFIPGLTFISLTHMDAVNLLHQRYRWAKEHNVEKKNVNIYEMLEEERNNLGKRSLRTMFRPWKSGK